MEMKDKVIAGVMIILLASLQVALLGCRSEENKKGIEIETENVIKEVVVENNSRYVFKKIYVKDKLGRIHEILTSSSGNTMGGVGMLELCVYEEENTGR